MPTPLRRRDARPDALLVAPRLLGALLTAHGVTVRLTEVEAYRGGDDPGSHAFRGLTPRTEPMFRVGGHLYAYFTYGMHWCLNLVTGPAGAANALLLRAGEVVAGEDLAGTRSGAPRTPLPRHRLASGPARLARVLAIGPEHSGVDALGAASPVRFRLCEPVSPERIRTGPRVGVAGDGGDGERFPWRFWIEGEPSVSPYRAAKPRGRAPSGIAAPDVLG